MTRITSFHRSIGEELNVVRDRVRLLMDHPGEDGRYKEAILMNIINRFLPKNYSVGTGFIVSRGRHSTQEEHKSSSQVDLIIYNNEFPILFKEGDFVIVTPDSVKGIIEVKSNLENCRLAEVIKKNNKLGSFIYQSSNSEQGIFNGIFSYDGYETLGNIDQFKKKIREEMDRELEDQDVIKIPYLVNHIAFSSRYFLKYRNDNHPRLNALGLYDIPKLSFTYFISNLLDKISPHTKLESSLWYPKDKELTQMGIDF